MNYIKQLNAFWRMTMLNNIAPAETALYMAILHCGNISGWKQNLSIPNSTLLNLAKISNRAQLNRLRRKLSKAGLIKYKDGKRGSAGIYTIVCLYDDTNSDTSSVTSSDTNIDTSSVTNSDTNNDTYSDTNNDTSYVTSSDTNIDTNSVTNVIPYINKNINKTKQNIKPPISPKGIVEEYTQNQELREALFGLFESRKKQRSPVTERAVRLMLKTLDKEGKTDADKIALVNQSIEFGWKGIYPLKTDRGRQFFSKKDTGIYQPGDYDSDTIDRLMREKYGDGTKPQYGTVL